MGETYKHKTVNHGRKRYVTGDAHVNSIEGFWGLLKRGILGVYHYTSRKHLSRYVAEFEFRYNTRYLDDFERMDKLLARVVGKRLKYKTLISHGKEDG